MTSKWMVLLKFKKMQKKQEDLCRFGLEFLNSYDRVFLKKKKFQSNKILKI